MKMYCRAILGSSWVILGVLLTSCATIDKVATDLTSPIRPSEPTLLEIWDGVPVTDNGAIVDEAIRPLDTVDLSTINALADHSREIEVVITSGTALFLYRRFQFQPASVVLAHNEVKILTLWRDFGKDPGKPQSIQVLVGYVHGAFHFDIVSTRLDPSFSSLTSGFSQGVERAWFTGGADYGYTGELSSSLFRTGAGDVHYFIRALKEQP